ncbi:Coiled-coil domain-containing protein 86 [Plasmodiophora brassicae]|uniref:Coiled-coil domain-containing protein 86 n=1 Tax=Plasmodiophora brassicae TaxID=37360 RepID=A0A0G4IHD5_PLABS|nr:hypothetical protein PBRA_000388 [Plasmodiophora brassicae]SPQ96943.1 unnamed protein product [Plasmodiophora brassicae]
MTSVAEVPRSRPVNGRVWKTIQKSRHSSTMRTGAAGSFAKRLQEREKLQAARIQQQALIEEIKATKAEERRRRAQKRATKEANEKKSQVVQVISDTSKLKKLTKKQLKMIRKQ